MIKRSFYNVVIDLIISFPSIDVKSYRYPVIITPLIMNNSCVLMIRNVHPCEQCYNVEFEGYITTIIT